MGASSFPLSPPPPRIQLYPNLWYIASTLLQCLRIQLCYLRPYLFTCKQSIADEFRQKMPAHLYDHIDLYSLSVNTLFSWMYWCILNCCKTKKWSRFIIFAIIPVLCEILFYRNRISCKFCKNVYFQCYECYRWINSLLNVNES